MKPKFHPRDVYGRRLFYPVNNLAGAICAFVEAKTLNQRQFDALEGLGFQVSLEYEVKNAIPA